MADAQKIIAMLEEEDCPCGGRFELVTFEVANMTDAQIESMPGKWEPSRYSCGLVCNRCGETMDKDCR